MLDAVEILKDLDVTTDWFDLKIIMTIKAGINPNDMKTSFLQSPQVAAEVEKAVGSLRPALIGQFLASRDYKLSIKYLEGMDFINGESRILKLLNSFLLIQLIVYGGGNTYHYFTKKPGDEFKRFMVPIRYFAIVFCVLDMAVAIILFGYEHFSGQVTKGTLTTVYLTMLTLFLAQFVYVMKMIRGRGYARWILATLAAGIVTAVPLLIVAALAEVAIKIPVINAYVRLLG